MVDTLTDDGSYRAQQEHEMIEHKSTTEDVLYIARNLLPEATREKYETFRLD